MNTRKLIPAIVLAFLAIPAFAQSAASETQRDVNQQQRIDNGLKSGQLTTREAAGLERQESRVDHAEAGALKDGKLSAAEKSRIQTMQNRSSANISKESHNGQTGNPNSASSVRMQADVARDANQERRIQAGVKNGSLTNHEVSKLERGQARGDHSVARAGRNGVVSAAEQRRLQRAENRRSARIRREKHDAQQRG